MHHWPGEGDGNCSESSTNNENLMVYKMEGQYQILYKENALKASSSVRTSVKWKFVVFYEYLQSYMAYHSKLVMTIANIP